MDRPIRICLHSGPGSGKSATAAWLFSELKQTNLDIQLIDEYIKKWAYAKKRMTSFDQVYMFAKHMYSEEGYLRENASIVTDAPLLLIAAYCKRNNDTFAEDLFSLAVQFELKYPSINILLDRGDIPYKQEGRFESYDAALKMDKIVEEVLEEYQNNYILTYSKINTKDRNGILNYVKGKIWGQFS